MRQPVDDVRPLLVGLAASTRRGGNSDTLLGQLLQSAETHGAETETIVLSALSVAACTGCQRCRSTGECVLKDDFQAIRDRVLAANAIVIATPAYFWGFPSPAKAFIDRNQSMWARRALIEERKERLRPAGVVARGILIAVAADPSPRFDGLRTTADAMLRAYDIELWDELLVTGLFDLDEARKSEEILGKARDLGERLVHAAFA